MLIYRHLMKLMRKLNDGSSNKFGLRDWEGFCDSKGFKACFNTFEEYLKRYELEFLRFEESLEEEEKEILALDEEKFKIDGDFKIEDYFYLKA